MNNKVLCLGAGLGFGDNPASATRKITENLNNFIKKYGVEEIDKNEYEEIRNNFFNKCDLTKEAFEFLLKIGCKKIV